MKEKLPLQIETEQLDLESRIRNLNLKLSTNFAEEAEIIETGFSFSSSLKDISRFIFINLTEQLGGNITNALYIVDNWERFVKALDDPSLVNQEEEILFSIFTNVYYDSIDYFKKQFLSHLGEKVELASEYIEDPKVKKFVDDTGFRQRKFSYPIEQAGKSSIQAVTASTTRTFEIKKSEREKVELLNSLFVRFILRPYEVEALEFATLQKFPELESELNLLIENTKNIKLNIGDNLIEISPPFENYTYQHDCMVRIYTYTVSGFDINQYSIPFCENEMNIAIQNLLTSFNAQALPTNIYNVYSSNNILSNFFIANSLNSTQYLNSFPSVIDYGGAGVIESAAAIINPRIEQVGNEIHPYIVEYINSPSFVQDSNHQQSVNRYSEIFLTAIATLDINIQNENPQIEAVLESGVLLSTAVAGFNTSQLLLEASKGEVSSFEVSSSGYCDTVTGTVGANNGVEKLSFSEKEIEAMKFEGKVTSLSKDGDLELNLMKYIDKDGKEKSLFICPVCKAHGITNYVDICAQSCPKCDVELKDLRIASENRNLGTFVQSYFNKTSLGNGIFGVLFDLFGAVFNLF